jgi:hypothetical protein
MRLTIAVFVFLILGGTSCIHAETSNSKVETSDAVTRKLFINPSSTSVALANHHDNRKYGTVTEFSPGDALILKS